MAIKIGKIFNTKTIDEKIVRAITQSRFFSGVFYEIQPNADGYIKHGYQGNADVYSIVRKYINMGESAKLVLKRKLPDGKSEVITDHDLTKLLTMANPGQTMQEFREAYAVYMLILGNSFWYKPKLEKGLNKGKSFSIYTLPANDVEVSSKTKSILTKDVKYRLEGTRENFDIDEILHSKYFNPMFYNTPTLLGQSPLEAALTVLSKQNEAEKTMARQFNNQGPAYMLYRDSQDAFNVMTDAQKEALEKEMNSLAKKGKQGSGIVLKEKFGAIKLGVTAADMQVLESSKSGRRVLCNVYQMPAALFNDPDGSTYNNVKEARKAAWTDALIPFNNRFANDLTRFLIYPVEEWQKQGLYFAMDYSEVEELQSGMKEKVEWMGRAKWSANEIRKATGKDEDERPEMNEPIFNSGDILASDVMLDENLETDDSDYNKE